MNKFELTMRHTVAIVSYIAASMGYSKEEIKYIAGNMKFGSDDIGEFQEILAEPLDDIHSVKYNGEVKDLVGSFNLAERIQMVIDLILKKSNLEDGDDLPMKSYLSATVSAYKNSPFKFSNFIRNPEEEPGMTAHEEYLVDEAIRKATEETIRDLKGKEVEIEKFDEERLEEREMEIQNQSKDSEDTKETIEVRFYNSTEEANLVKESIKIERTSRSSTWCDGMHIAAGSFNGHVVEIFPKEILHKLSEDLSKRTPNELFSFICGDADNLYIDNDQLTFPKLSLSANGLSPKSIAVVTTTRGDNGKGLISVKVDVDRLKITDISKEDIADTLKAVSNKHQIDLSKGSIVVNGILLNTTYIRVMRKLQDERVKEVLKLIEKAVKNIFNNRKLTNWLLAGADF